MNGTSLLKLTPLAPGLAMKAAQNVLELILRGYFEVNLVPGFVVEKPDPGKKCVSVPMQQ